MESFNGVQLLGVISGVTKIQELGGTKQATFTVVTNQMYRDASKAKVLEPERHTVKLKDAATIARSLVDGKAIFVNGRLKYSDTGAAYVRASNVSFPGEPR